MNRIIGSFLYLVLIPFSLLGEYHATTGNDSTRVAVVLSGGGAKGFAHVGFLKALDELNIKIDYISGTSMGAIVGGLYAMGYSAVQIETLLKDIDFYTLLLDLGNRPEYNFLKKQDYNTNKFTFELNEQWEFEAPQSISKGQNLLSLLSRVSLPVHQVNTLDSLPIPFLVVGTDAKKMTGENLDNMPLQFAMRASSSLPGLFAPFRFEHKVYLDGGMYNNLPADEVKKQFNPDLILAHNVASSWDSIVSDEIYSFVMKMMTLQDKHQEDEQNRVIDLKIDTRMPEGANTTSFDLLGKISKLGYENTYRFRQEIAAKFPQRIMAKPKVQIPSKDSVVYIKRIVVSGNEDRHDGYYKDKLYFAEGNAVTLKTIKNSLDYIYSFDNLNNIAYTYNALDSTLTVYTMEKHDHRTLSLGLYSDSYNGHHIGLGLTLQSDWIAHNVIKSNLTFGQHDRASISYIFDNGYALGFGIKANYKEYEATNTSDSIKVTVNNEEDFTFLSYQFKHSRVEMFLLNRYYNDYLFALGWGMQNLKVTQKKSNRSPLKGSPITYYSFADLYFDQLDDTFFPTKGWRLHARYKSIFSRFDDSNTIYDNSEFSLNMSLVQELVPDIYLQLNLSGFQVFGEVHGDQYRFLGGESTFNLFDNVLPFDGYRLDDIQAVYSNYLALTSDFRWNYTQIHHFGLRLNYAFLKEQEVNNLNRSRNMYDHKYSLSTYFSALVLKVPITLKLSRQLGSDSNYFAFASFGYNF